MCGIFLFSKCINNESKRKEDSTEVEALPTKTIAYGQFAGSVECANCHKEIHNNYIHTAHYLTSQNASEKNIKGSFAPNQNYYAYRPDRIVALEHRDSGFYQVYYSKGIEKLARRFDIVVGSGTKGQTYLSWVNSYLIELPVSYFTQEKNWANSPGYPLSPILFNRPATTRCLECHSTFAATLTSPFEELEKFDSTKMILTVGCEKCHGPAAQHVTYHTQHPGDTGAKFVINPAKLPGKLNLDVCNLCHSGRLQKTKPSFEFVPGDTLSDYFAISNSVNNAVPIDVHGNQYGLLAASNCFRASKTMTCITCHNVHKNERGRMEIFSQRCMSCHSAPHKKIEGLTDNQLVKNCINCHMPVQQSMTVGFILQGQTVPTPAMMRTHFISIYADETKKFVSNLKSKGSK